MPDEKKAPANKEEKKQDEKAVDKKASEKVQEEPKKAKPKKEEKKAKDEKEAPKADKQSLPSGKIGDLIKEIEKLTVIERADLGNALEDRFGVSASAPVAMGVMPSGGADAGEATPEKTEFDVVLSEIGGL